MREPSHLLTPTQVAHYCGVTAKTVNDWLVKGRLHANDDGPLRTVETSALVSFMDQNHLAIPVDLLNLSEEQAKEGPVYQPNSACSQKKPLALIVDSDSATSLAIEAVLTELGVGTARVSSTQDALLSYRAAQPALITLNLEPEDTKGIDLIQEIRQRRTTKILVVSSQMPSALTKAKTAGADVIMAKPFDNDTLKRTVRILLDTKKDSE